MTIQSVDPAERPVRGHTVVSPVDAWSLCSGEMGTVQCTLLGHTGATQRVWGKELYGRELKLHSNLVSLVNEAHTFRVVPCFSLGKVWFVVHNLLVVMLSLCDMMRYCAQCTYSYRCVCGDKVVWTMRRESMCVHGVTIAG